MKNRFLILLLFIGSALYSSAQCSVPVREAFGSTASVALYNTYVTIGAIADGYVANTYTGERVQSLMGEQVTMMTVLQSQLTLAKSDDSGSLTASDREYIGEVILCVGYLESEARSLQEYVATGAADANTSYTTNRDLAWSLIKDLLGLDGEE